MAGLLLVFSMLIYIGGEALLHRFVDGRLLALAEMLAKIVEQYPNIINESSDEDFGLAAEMIWGKKEQNQLDEVPHSLRVFSPDGRMIWKNSNACARTSPSRECRVRNRWVVR
jgi:hypothetical protein